MFKLIYMVGILLISTRKYKQFVPPLLSQIDELFLPDYPKTIFLFTDEYQRGLPHLKNEVRQIIIPSYGFPYATLYRYDIFTRNANALAECSHLYYLDVDMKIVAPTHDNILVDGLFAVRHPGFFTNSFGWGSPNNPKESNSYLPEELRVKYYCGGCQGGDAESYIKASAIMAASIKDDESRGVKAEWHDETVWNWLTHSCGDDFKVNEFDCRYCIPEPMALREKWGILDISPVIIALDKKHSEIRS